MLLNMASFTFSVNKPVNKNQTSKPTVKKPIQSKVKVELTMHETTNYEPEYYSYVDANGESHKYSGIVLSDIDGSYVGKVINTHKVILDYHPTVETVKPVDEYFSYIDNNGIERIFIGTPIFDSESNTYYGEVVESILEDKIIEIFKDK
jgi:hypothetical protein